MKAHEVILAIRRGEFSENDMAQMIRTMYQNLNENFLDGESNYKQGVILKFLLAMADDVEKFFKL